MTSAPTPRRGLSEIALATGLGSIACAVLHLLTELGWLVAGPCMVLGILGVVCGVLALRARQPRGMAITGIVSGALGFVFMAGLFVFALIFIGAFA